MTRARHRAALLQDLSRKPINRPLGTSKVKLIIKETAVAAGFTPEEVQAFSGHSLRVGAAWDLLCAGLDTAAIMRAGGCKSINVLGRYLKFVSIMCGGRLSVWSAVVNEFISSTAAAVW